MPSYPSSSYSESVYSPPRPILEATARETAENINHLLYGAGAAHSIDYADFRRRLEAEESLAQSLYGDTDDDEDLRPASPLPRVPLDDGKAGGSGEDTVKASAYLRQPRDTAPDLLPDRGSSPDDDDDDRRPPPQTMATPARMPAGPYTSAAVPADRERERARDAERKLMEQQVRARAYTRSPSPDRRERRFDNPPSDGPLPPPPEPLYSEFYIPSPDLRARRMERMARPEEQEVEGRAGGGGPRWIASPSHLPGNGGVPLIPAVDLEPAWNPHRGQAQGQQQRKGATFAPSPAPDSSTPLSSSASATDATTSELTTSGTATGGPSTTSLGSVRGARRRGSTTHANRAFRALSEFLASKGMPPLPPNVMASHLPESVQVALDHGVSQVMDEFHRRGNLIQELVKKLNQHEDQDAVAGRVRRPAAAAGARADDASETTEDLKTRLDRVLERQQGKPRRSGGGSSGVEGGLRDAAQDANDLRIKYEQLRSRAEREEAEASVLRQELAAVAAKLATQQKRAEATVANVRAQHRRPAHGALDPVTADIVNVYESKVEGMKNELDALRRMARKVSRADEVGGTYAPLPPPIPEPEDPMTNPGSDQFLRLKHTMEQQVLLLQKKLELQAAATARAEEERDLLQLKLVNATRAPVPPSVAAAKGPNGEPRATRDRNAPVGSTRDLIRRDKLHYKLRLHIIDELPAESVRDILKDICIRLDIDDVHNVVPSLEQSAILIGTVPKMREFISSVDGILWQRPFGVDEGAKQPAPSSDDGTALPASVAAGKGRKPPRTIQKFSKTLKVLRAWSDELAVLEHLRRYVARVFRVLDIDPARYGGLGVATEDTEAELMGLEEVKRLVAFEKNQHRVDRKQKQLAGDEVRGISAGDAETYRQIVHHFCALFEVKTIAAAMPKLNELFAFVTETEHGVKRLRDALPGLEKVSTAAVLNRAADELTLATFAGDRADVLEPRRERNVSPIQLVPEPARDATGAIDGNNKPVAFEINWDPAPTGNRKKLIKRGVREMQRPITSPLLPPPSPTSSVASTVKVSSAARRSKSPSPAPRVPLNNKGKGKAKAKAKPDPLPPAGAGRYTAKVEDARDVDDDADADGSENTFAWLKRRGSADSLAFDDFDTPLFDQALRDVGHRDHGGDDRGGDGDDGDNILRHLDQELERVTTDPSFSSRLFAPDSRATSPRAGAAGSPGRPAWM
ncbi:hypothetical protein H9P43_004249 [Blastocladiella emersonii ATCC 22665]|nr:hypothetical protein H9P43_004249 [Blastocladiella emersonii ATCC 22665]